MHVAGFFRIIMGPVPIANRRGLVCVWGGGGRYVGMWYPRYVSTD